MLHAIVGHTYTKYTHKMHKYTDAQIHELYTQIHKENALKTKNPESATKWEGEERDEEEGESSK